MAQSSVDLVTYYQGSHYRQYPHEVRSGGSVPLGFIHGTHGAHETMSPPLDDLILAVCLDVDMPFRWDIGDGWTKTERNRSGDLTLAPAGTSIAYEFGGPYEIVAVGIPAQYLDSMLESHGLTGRSELDAVHSDGLFRDEIVRTSALRMWAESAQHGAAQGLLIDGLLQVVISQLLRRAGKTIDDTDDAPLAQPLLNRLDDFLAANLDKPLTQKELIDALETSSAGFAARFKNTTGQTPHQYVLSRRIARAQELLSARTMPLAEIAYACGFASQSHMTDVFRQKLGVTPGRYRKEVRS